jgi:hypothetical protein
MVQQAGIDSDQGQFLKGINSYTGEIGAAEMGAHMIADVLRERSSDADRSYRVFTGARSLTRVFLAGLAFDFCVRYSAEDARRAGFSVLVIEDPCSIDVGGSAEAARSAFQNLAIQSIAAGDFAQSLICINDGSASKGSPDQSTREVCNACS